MVHQPALSLSLSYDIPLTHAICVSLSISVIISVAMMAVEDGASGSSSA
jgi:hypothetical protein